MAIVCIPNFAYGEEIYGSPGFPGRVQTGIRVQVVRMVKKRFHVYVSGVVQGVSFRYHTLRRALQANVTGWVRNLRDGRVEAVFEGDEDEVDAIVEWCRSGPTGASVRKVEVIPEPPTGQFRDFEIVH